MKHFDAWWHLHINPPKISRSSFTPPHYISPHLGLGSDGRNLRPTRATWRVGSYTRFPSETLQLGLGIEGGKVQVKSRFFQWFFKISRCVLFEVAKVLKCNYFTWPYAIRPQKKVCSSTLLDQRAEMRVGDACSIMPSEKFRSLGSCRPFTAQVIGLRKTPHGKNFWLHGQRTITGMKRTCSSPLLLLLWHQLRNTDVFFGAFGIAAFTPLILSVFFCSVFIYIQNHGTLVSNQETPRRTFIASLVCSSFSNLNQQNDESDFSLTQWNMTFFPLRLVLCSPCTLPRQSWMGTFPWSLPPGPTCHSHHGVGV